MIVHPTHLRVNYVMVFLEHMTTGITLILMENAIMHLLTIIHGMRRITVITKQIMMLYVRNILDKAMQLVTVS